MPNSLSMANIPSMITLHHSGHSNRQPCVDNISRKSQSSGDTEALQVDALLEKFYLLQHRGARYP